MYKIIRKPKCIGIPFHLIVVCFFLFFVSPVAGQKKAFSKAKVAKPSGRRVIYGSASFYHNKFDGRRTASGEIFNSDMFTCACNMLPFGTWIKVTNVRNGRSVVVKVNDRLHLDMRRIADLSPAAAKKLRHKEEGLIRVKVEVIGSKKPIIE